MKKIAILCVLTLSVGLGAAAASSRVVNCLNDFLSSYSTCSAVINTAGGAKDLGTGYTVHCTAGGDWCQWYTQTDIAKWNGSTYVDIAGSPFKVNHTWVCGADQIITSDDWQTVASGTYRVKSKLFKGPLGGGGVQLASDQQVNMVIP